MSLQINMPEGSIPAGNVTLVDDPDTGGWIWCWDMPCGAAQSGWADTEQAAQESAMQAIEAWYRALT